MNMIMRKHEETYTVDRTIIRDNGWSCVDDYLRANLWNQTAKLKQTRGLMAYRTDRQSEQDEQGNFRFTYVWTLYIMEEGDVKIG